MTYPIQVTIILWCLALGSLGGVSVVAAWAIRVVVNQWDRLLVEMNSRRQERKWKPLHDALMERYGTLETQYDALFDRYSKQIGD